MYVLDSPLRPPLARSSFVFLLVWDPLLHTRYTSQADHFVLFTIHAHNHRKPFCCSTEIMSSVLNLSLSLSQLTTWKSVLYLNTTRPPTDSRKQTDECFIMHCHSPSKGKGSPYSNTERRVLELIPVLGSQPASDVNHKPGGRLLLLSVRPAVTPTTLKRAATNFAAW